MTGSGGKGSTRSHRLRYDGHGAVGVVQHGMRHPAELEAEVALAPLGADNKQIRGCRTLHQHLVGRALDRGPVHLHCRVVTDELSERLVQQRRGPLLVVAGRIAGEHRMVRRLMRWATPGTDRLDGGAAGFGLAQGERDRRLSPGCVSYAEEDPPVRSPECRPVAAHNDDWAVRLGRNGQTDRAQQQPPWCVGLRGRWPLRASVSTQFLIFRRLPWASWRTRRIRLGGDAPDAAGASGFDGFGEGVLRAAVVALDTVPQAEVALTAAFGPYHCKSGQGNGRVRDKFLVLMNGVGSLNKSSGVLIPPRAPSSERLAA